MDTTNLKKFAQYARRYLKEQVSRNLQRVLTMDSAAQRENPKAVAELNRQIATTSTEQVIDKAAYIWFNRFCALRFLDVNRYNRIGILSPAEGQSQPEILAEAKMGHIDETMVPESIRRQVVALLSGSTPSQDPQGEAYRLLLVAACNDGYKTMPYLFERIADYTELLLPDDLLSGNSILSYIREAMTSEVCEDVEVIGWLYQHYISEKKDEVFEGLKKGKKITPENIPAATQLFTPHWIVRYLVENSLGRLWLQNRPHSKLAARMDYYIRPEQPETDFLKIGSPEDLKMCDPACGSGHMLTYAFDLLYAIYEEEGYPAAEIPARILNHNLYGIEIDERAGSLAAFALTMKARAKNRGFFRQPVSPSICVLENIHFEPGELQAYMDAVGRDLFTVNLETTLQQFEEADNFGSLIRPELKDAGDILRLLASKELNSNLFLQATHEKVLKVIRQADFLGPKYHVVIANPPYMGSGGMNSKLIAFAQARFPNSKSDLFAMFIERNFDLIKSQGMVAMITMQSWMFLSSFEKMRGSLLELDTLLTMAHLGPRAFDSIGGEVVSTTAFVFEKMFRSEYKGANIRLVDGKSEEEKKTSLLEAVQNPKCDCLYHTSSTDFKKIPGSPIAYWVSQGIRNLFANADTFESHFIIKAGMSTGKNEEFIFFWPEVEYDLIRTTANTNFAYTPHNKGGEFRKWMGNWESVLKYSPRHLTEMERNPGFRHDGKEYYFMAHIGWSKITSSKSSFRYYPDGFSFDSAGLALFSNNKRYLYDAMGFLNSKIASEIIQILNPTLNVTPQVLKKMPLIQVDNRHRSVWSELYEETKCDWNSFETSWEFATHPLLRTEYRNPFLNETYSDICAQWQSLTLEIQKLETENNRIFIEAYGLQDELTPDVPLKEITLTCNPHYRYGGDKPDAELETLLLADTMKEFISYAVGCMFGRYALEKPGLILANQGETLEDYLRQIPEPSFPADRDNVIPIIEGDWFAEDIAARFRRFLRLTFGEERFAENLRFIEEAIGKDIGKYFAKDFYTDHVKRYKKRPIYWLFSSQKGSFNALIYMHRYRPDTVSVVLNDYLREYRTKLSARKAHLEQVSISGSVSTGEKAKALKEIESLKKILDELMQYERDVLYPLAAQKLEIDLDDGVKVNYLKFGAALRKIPGLDAVEE